MTEPFEVIDFLRQDHPSLKALVTIKVPAWGDFIIYDMPYFEREGKRWVTWPTRQKKVEGEPTRKPWVGFEDKKTGRLFLEKVLKAVEVYLS